MPGELDASFDQPVESAPAETETEVVVEDSLGNQFLMNIPEQDRPIVAKYVKDWDGNVTKKFQSIHEQYKPYKELGVEPENLRKAWTAIQNLNSNPEESYRRMTTAMIEKYGPEAFMTEVLRIQRENAVSDAPNEQFDVDENAVYNDPRYDQLAEKYDQIVQWQQEQETAAVEAQEMQALDAHVADMHNKHGDFDDAWYLLKISQGLTPDQAIESFNNLTGRGNSQSVRPAPKILGGQGGIPSDQVDPTKLNASDRKALIANLFNPT
jgi:hypothetical protein